MGLCLGYGSGRYFHRLNLESRQSDLRKHRAEGARLWLRSRIFRKCIVEKQRWTRYRHEQSGALQIHPCRIFLSKGMQVIRGSGILECDRHTCPTAQSISRFRCVEVQRHNHTKQLRSQERYQCRHQHNLCWRLCIPIE